MAVQPAIVGELGMEGADQHRPLAAHRSGGSDSGELPRTVPPGIDAGGANWAGWFRCTHPGQDFDSRADRLDNRRPDEHRVHRPICGFASRQDPAVRAVRAGTGLLRVNIVEARDRQVALERLGLASISVASHDQVDTAERALTRAPVDNRAGHKDQPGAGSKNWETRRQSNPERSKQTRRIEQHGHGGGLPPRKHDAGQLSQISRPPNEHDVDPDIGQGLAMFGHISLESKNSDPHLEAPCRVTNRARPAERRVRQPRRRAWPRLILG